MGSGARGAVAVTITALWVNASEFFRNEVLLRGHWIGHFRALGLAFPSAPLNAALWILWGVCLALLIYAISRRCSLVQAAVIAWFAAFPMMWLVLWNLLVLPGGILAVAVPLSMLEVAVGTYICKRIATDSPA